MSILKVLLEKKVYLEAIKVSDMQLPATCNFVNEILVSDVKRTRKQLSCCKG